MLASGVSVDLEKVEAFMNWVSPYGIIAFACTVTLCGVGCGCTVRSFTTHGECGLGLSLGLRPMKTHSSIQEMKSN